MPTAKEHLHKATSHHAAARNAVREAAAAAAAEAETKLLREREVADAKAAAESQGG